MFNLRFYSTGTGRECPGCLFLCPLIFSHTKTSWETLDWIDVLGRFRRPFDSCLRRDDYVINRSNGRGVGGRFVHKTVPLC